MKKTLLILCALLLTAIGASAQITDVTEKYIQNASFEEDDVSNLTVDGTRASEVEGVQTGAWTVTSLTNWTLTNASNFDVVDLMTKDAKETDNNLGVPGEAADGDYMLYLKKTWTGDNTTLQASVKQTVELPAGAYKLTVDSKCFTGGASANLVAGSASNAIIINGTSGGNADNGYYPMTELTEWTTNELTFTVTPEEGAETVEVSIGVEFTLTNNAPGSFVLDNFKLYSYDYNVTKVLANPSFEEDDPAAAEWEADTNSSGDARCNSDSKGAWIIPSSSDGSLELTGWSLKRMGSEEVFDIMTKDAAATDNGLGGPGEAADGTYMLYMKKTWGEEDDQTSYVEQTVTLPAGDYMVTVDSKFFSNAATAKLVAGEASVDIHINAATATTNILPETEWTTNTLTFTLNETTELTIGVEMTFANASLGSLLLDNFQLFSAQDVVVWEMTDAKWGTMIIPFEADVPDGLTLYAGEELKLEEDGSTLTVGTASQTIAANTPYLVKGTEGTYTFSGTPENEEDSYTSGMLVGTLVDMTYSDFTANSGQYVLQNQEAGLAFYLITAESQEVTLGAYHCYLTSSVTPTALHLPGMETGIVAVEGAEAEANGAIYDLSGRRVAKAVKGVYIQNGKKVLVR